LGYILDDIFHKLFWSPCFQARWAVVRLCYTVSPAQLHLAILVPALKEINGFGTFLRQSAYKNSDTKSVNFFSFPRCYKIVRSTTFGNLDFSLWNSPFWTTNRIKIDNIPWCHAFAEYFLQSNEVFQALAVGLSGIDQEQVRIPQERKVQQFALLVCVCLRKNVHIIVDEGFQRSSNQDCQIFHGTTYQNGENVSNDHKIYQMAIKYTKWP
jgi:hypothetical protein